MYGWGENEQVFLDRYNIFRIPQIFFRTVSGMTRVGAAGACTPGTSLRTARPTCTACTRGWLCSTGEAAPPAPGTLQLLARSGAAAGLLFLNSAAQELALTPAPGLVYRTIGGLLDLYLFLGPEPEQVQYSTVQHSIAHYSTVPSRWCSSTRRRWAGTTSRRTGHSASTCAGAVIDNRWR